MTIMTVPHVASALFDESPWYAFRGADAGVWWRSVPELPNANFRWADDTEVQSPHVTLTQTAVAELLFCTSLDPCDDHPSPDEIWTAVERQLAACRCDLTECMCTIAQEAGDHPQSAADRMTWCLELAARVLNPFGGD